MEVYKKLDSTNNIAKQRTKHGTVILAEEQTAGYGRRGRSFYSPPGHGIYMSLVIDPAKLGFASTPTLITVHTAVAVCEAIEEFCGKSPKIKWVNDIFLDGKKICGISAEASERIVVGVGINLNYFEPPEELAQVIGTVFGKDEEPNIGKIELAEHVADNILTAPQSQAKLIESYKKRLFILGKKVQVTAVGTNTAYEATALDIDEQAQLIVKTEDGKIVSLFSGEISVSL